MRWFSMDDIDFKELIEDALSRQMRDEEGNSRFLATNWVLVSEWVDYDGNRFLDTQMSDEMTPWNAVGMLSMASKGIDLFDSAVVLNEEEDNG